MAGMDQHLWRVQWPVFLSIDEGRAAYMVMFSLSSLGENIEKCEDGKWMRLYESVLLSLRSLYDLA